MSWDNIVLSLQEASNTLLGENYKVNSAGNTKTKTKTKNKTKSKNSEEENIIAAVQLPLDVLLKASKQLTTSLEDVELLLKERDVSFNNTSLATDESIHDLIPSHEADNVDKDKMEVDEETNTGNASGRTAIVLQNAPTNTIGAGNTTTVTQAAPAVKGRGRGRPQGSTSARAQAQATSTPGSTGPNVSSKFFSGKSNTGGVTASDAGADEGSNNASNDAGNTASNSAASEKLITIGARYGYPPPPPLSTYNGKIGRSFYTSPYNPSTPILPNSQVAYCPSNGRDSNSFATTHSEWILCRVLRVISETRFEIQDPEPDELHPQGQVFRANYKEIILVPLHLVSSSISRLKEYKVGTRVLAKYPETTTFYPAEVMASKNGSCMLRFEGEEEVGKLTPVDRVFVLPCPK